MDAPQKKRLRARSLALRHTLDSDLEQRLQEIGVRQDRAARPADELRLTAADRAARVIVDSFFTYRAGVPRESAFREFAGRCAYSWANRLLVLRIMEVRGIVTDEVVLQSPAYGGRSLLHHRFARQHPEACTGEDEGLFAVRDQAFHRYCETTSAAAETGLR